MLRDLRFAIAPRWLAWHGALLVALVACIWLGNWQLDSFAETGRRQHAAAVQAAAPVSEVLAPGDRLPSDAVGRAVTAIGRYDEANRLLVPGRRLGNPGNKEGYWVVTPLKTAEGVLPVNRGWVATPDDPAVEGPAAEVTVTGLLQPSESEHDSQVDPLANLPDGQISYLATVQLLDVLPYSPEELYDGYVVLRSEQPAQAVTPKPVQATGLDEGVGRWRNLGYGLQWWFFAAAAVFFWWSVLRRSLRERRAAAQVQAPTG
ncbi:MAG: SURF1 family protein [Sporichthyaceae bacterium]